MPDCGAFATQEDMAPRQGGDKLQPIHPRPQPAHNAAPQKPRLIRHQPDDVIINKPSVILIQQHQPRCFLNFL
jgi:hypothetical protein